MRAQSFAVIDTGLDYTHDAFQTMPQTPRFSQSDIESRIQSTTALKMMAAKGATMSVDDVYINEKVPYEIIVTPKDLYTATKGTDVL